MIARRACTIWPLLVLAALSGASFASGWHVAFSNDDKVPQRSFRLRAEQGQGRERSIFFPALSGHRGDGAVAGMAGSPSDGASAGGNRRFEDGHGIPEAANVAGEPRLARTGPGVGALEGAAGMNVFAGEAGGSMLAFFDTSRLDGLVKAVRDVSGRAAEEVQKSVDSPEVKNKVANAKRGLDQALDGVLLAVDKAQKFAEKVDKRDERFGEYYEAGDRFLEELSINAKQAWKKASRSANKSRRWAARHLPVSVATFFDESLGEAKRLIEADDVGDAFERFRRKVPILDQALLDFEERWINLESQNPLVSEAVLAGGSGAAAYLAVLSAAQRACLRASLSAASRTPASLIGFAAIATAGIMAGEASHMASSWRRERAPSYVVRALPPISRRRTLDQRVEDATLSVLVYRLLFRGAFAGVAPSDISRPGVFAREFEPAKGEMYATYAERVRVNGIGWKRGCHTCGSRLPGGFMGVSKKWICDHQPPNKIVSMGEQQRFYPHCNTCSSKQSDVLRQWGFRSPLILHWPTFAASLSPLFLSIRPACEGLEEGIRRTQSALRGEPLYPPVKPYAAPTNVNLKRVPQKAKRSSPPPRKTSPQPPVHAPKQQQQQQQQQPSGNKGGKAGKKGGMGGGQGWPSDAFGGGRGFGQGKKSRGRGKFDWDSVDRIDEKAKPRTW